MEKISQVLFLLSSNPDNLSASLAEFDSTATVEAEYGDVVVEGTRTTLAHHGPRSHNPAPCLLSADVPLQVEAVGLSHVDLDSLGGCMALLASPAKGTRVSDGVRRFWSVAARIDIQGAHKLGEILGVGYTEAEREELLQLLHAFWAWSEANRCYAPRDGSVLDVSDWIHRATEVVEDLLLGRQPRQLELLADGHLHRVQEEALNESSFLHWQGTSGCIVRRSESFCNHLYTDPSGTVGKAVVALNPKTGAITVSLADPVPGISCRDLVQRFWGPLAGGHDGIAGSPRGEVLGEAELNAAAAGMAKALLIAFPD